MGPLIQDGYVYQVSGKRWQFLQITEGRVVAELALTPQQRKEMKPGIYGMEMQYLGTEESYKVGPDGDAEEPTEENE